MKTKIIAPIVHLNGTSKESLVSQLEDVYRALGELERALCASTPHGRDYYPEPGLLEQAQEQHYRRLQVVKDMKEEIVEQVNQI